MKFLSFSLLFFVGAATASPLFDIDIDFEPVYECKVISSATPPYIFEVINLKNEEEINFSRIEIAYIEILGEASNLRVIKNSRSNIFCEPGKMCKGQMFNIKSGESIQISWDGQQDDGSQAPKGEYQLRLDMTCDGNVTDACVYSFFQYCSFFVE